MSKLQSMPPGVYTVLYSNNKKNCKSLYLVQNMLRKYFTVCTVYLSGFLLFGGKRKTLINFFHEKKRVSVKPYCPDFKLKETSFVENPAVMGSSYDGL
jgi:hypothetical protein